jgi:hypothetical protein
MNDFGAITGDYLDANGVYHGFLRSPDGNFTPPLDAPGADLTPGDFNGTFPSNINLFGAIVGDYLDAGEVHHGILRSWFGTFTTFEVNGAGTGALQGTIPNSNNLFGAITGYYIDAGSVAHAFLAVPCDHWCFGSDEAATTATPLSPASALKSPTNANKVNPVSLVL